MTGSIDRELCWPLLIFVVSPGCSVKHSVCRLTSGPSGSDTTETLPPLQPGNNKSYFPGIMPQMALSTQLGACRPSPRRPGGRDEEVVAELDAGQCRATLLSDTRPIPSH